MVIQNWNLSGLSMDWKGLNPRDTARWDCPPMDWYKINFDGASKANPRIVGYGVVIRDAYGDKVGCMAILLVVKPIMLPKLVPPYMVSFMLRV